MEIVVEMQKTLEQKLVAVGDKKCGKSSLLIHMSKQVFLEVTITYRIYSIF